MLHLGVSFSEVSNVIWIRFFFIRKLASQSDKNISFFKKLSSLVPLMFVSEKTIILEKLIFLENGVPDFLLFLVI